MNTRAYNHWFGDSGSHVFGRRLLLTESFAQRCTKPSTFSTKTLTGDLEGIYLPGLSACHLQDTKPRLRTGKIMGTRENNANSPESVY